MKVFMQTMLLLCIAICSNGTKATPILFDFESGGNINPVFTVDGLTITYSSALPFVSQRVSDSRSLPFLGTGSMRLTAQVTGNSASAARVDFSSLLSSVSLWAIDFDFDATDHDFVISALSISNTVLDTFDVTSGDYTQVEFSGLGPIAALSFSANSLNVAYWDNLVATTVVSTPSTFSIVLLTLAGLSFQRSRRRII